MIFKFFEQRIAPFPETAPPREFRSLFDFIRQYSRGTEPYLLMLTCLTAIAAVLEVALFRFLGIMIDWMSNTSVTDFWPIYGDKLLLIGTVVLIGLPLINTLHSLVSHQTLLPNYPMRIRWLSHRHLLKQSYSFYQNEFAGRLATKVMQTSLAVREATMKLLDIGVYAVVYFVSIMVLVASLDMRLVLPFLCWLVSYSLILRFFLPRLGKVAMVQADARSEMTGRIVDTYTNIATVKLFSHSQRESAYVKAAMTQFLDTVYPQMRLATWLISAVWLANTLLFFGITALSIWLWLNSAITTGAIAAATGLALRLFGMSQWIMWEVSSLYENLGTAKDGMNTLAIKEEVCDSPQAGILSSAQGAIDFDRVCFNYGKPYTQNAGENTAVVKNFSLSIKAGEKIGLVGRSGAGKSTLVNLLLRFYDTANGDIFIDNKNIKALTQESLRQQIAMVTQDTSLLHRSVRENLLYGNPNASEQQMIQAAKQAKAHELIMQLSDDKGRCGYDAHVGERGVKLSGGQRQRIAIARVLLKDAPILILDEATSALDSEVEAAIQENLVKLMEGKTVIAIAHRLSTIAALDRLIVIDQGEIIETGTHQQLIKQDGIYAQLWSHQSGGFIGDQ